MKLILPLVLLMLIGCASTPEGVIGAQLIGVGVDSYNDAYNEVHHGIKKPTYKRQCAGLRGLAAEQCSDRVMKERRKNEQRKP